MTTDEALAQVAKVSEERRKKDNELAAIRERQYAVIREALTAGASAYSVAKASGLTQRAIHRIRDGHIGRA